MKFLFMSLTYLLLAIDPGQPQLCDSQEGYLCSDGKCVSKSRICNEITDCQRGEDEENCEIGKCGRPEVNTGKSKSSGARIVGGEDSVAGAWPWQALLTRYTRRRRGQTPLTLNERYLVGGGSLINLKWVMTAAHLFGMENSVRIRPSRYVISLGLNKRPSGGRGVDSSVQMFQAQRVYFHPNFSSVSVQNDIALVKLGPRLNPLTMKRIPGGAIGASHSRYVQPVCLPCTGTCLTLGQDKNGKSRRMSDEENCVAEETSLLKTGEDVVVSGFGYSSKNDPYGRRVNPEIPQNLQHATLKLVDRFKCWHAITSINSLLQTHLVFNEKMICCDSGDAKKARDACQGDSGGPLVKKVTNSITRESCWVQIGIVSFGYGCGTSYPGFYTNVARFVSWINSTTTSA